MMTTTAASPESATHSQEAPLRVLFVDDDQSLLDGLRRSMRSMRSLWTMSFANSGEEALTLMADQIFDVVVTDMRMPNIDGLQLLTRVRDDYPETIRIVLSGQTEMQTALRSVSIAQAFLHKPCEPDVIKLAIERTTSLADDLGNDTLRRMLAKVETLPSPPSVIQRLNECLMLPDVEIKQISEIVAPDVALTAKLLQLANSAYFGNSRSVSNAKDAITLLGVATVRDLATASKIFDALSIELSDPSLPARIEDHNVEVARIATALCGGAIEEREAYSAAVLHDIGELILAAYFPEDERIIQQRMTGGEARTDIENDLFGVTHAVLGAHLLRLWGLPQSVVEAVAWHHEAASRVPWEMNPLHSTFLAELIVDKGAAFVDFTPEGYIDALGCADVIAEIFESPKAPSIPQA